MKEKIVLKKLFLISGFIMLIGLFNLTQCTLDSMDDQGMLTNDMKNGHKISGSQQELISVETFGYEYQDVYCMYRAPFSASAKFQTEAVFINSAAPNGVSTFGINITGLKSAKNYHVDIGVQVKFDETYWSAGMTTTGRREYWAPAPAGMFTFTDDYSYNVNTPGTWTWNLGAEIKGFSIGGSYTTNTTASSGVYPDKTQNNYRYLGWFNSNNGEMGHDFRSLIKLHIINNIATKYYNGESGGTSGLSIFTRKIKSIRIRLDYKFEAWVINFFPIIASSYCSFILGDGTPNSDLKDIPLIMAP